jgi:DNA polymerase (family 10)
LDNYTIADQLSLLSKLMDIHGENEFKSKSYASAAFALEKLADQVADMAPEKITAVRGIGKSVGEKVIELLNTGNLAALNEILEKTPAGILDMLKIKGIGPKKIHAIWKDLHIDTIEDLKQACLENKIAPAKGFGEKTQNKILESIQFREQHQTSFMYVQVEAFAEALQLKLADKFKTEKIHITGGFRRQLEVVDKLEWVTTIEKDKLIKFFEGESFTLTSESNDQLSFMANDQLGISFYLADENNFESRLFETTGSDAFIAAWKSSRKLEGQSEKDIFDNASLPLIPAYLREKPEILNLKTIPDAVQTDDIRGLIHSHSTWSDGAHSLEDMAQELIRLGFEYLVISDHSKAAYYANGLDEKRILAQHKEIDALNKQLAPFKIYKSIECDILSDGTMDYPNAILSTFDLVIASIHSNLDMPEEKAMKRLLGAVTNPYVTIMGHLTGRLLTRRKGYPVDHKTIIDACAEHNTVIEINANPNRLDMDWRFVDYALEKNVLISINPDAHTTMEFHNLKYGVLVAQKAGVTKQQNLSSYSRAEFENFLDKRRSWINNKLSESL